ncbi:MAG: hypothetical protein WKF31_05555 [Thermoleophilaceae bacterium]
MLGRGAPQRSVLGPPRLPAQALRHLPPRRRAHPRRPLPLAALDALARPIDFARFREIVASSIDRLRSEELLDARAGLFGRRGVNVLDVNTLRHMRFRCVAVLGLNERSFPLPRARTRCCSTRSASR